MSIALQINNLSFHFDQIKANRFFNGLNLSFPTNNLHFIRGKNGAGKSTLFRLIQGRSHHDEYIEGQISIGDQKFDLANSEHRQYLSNTIRVVVQKFDLMLADQFTFKQNLELATIPHYPQLERFNEAQKIPELVKRFGINFDVPVERLSGGQRQILAILMALQKPTTVLLLDEPTAALDDKNAAMVISFLQELLSLDKNLTVLIICHDKEIVEQYAKKQYFQIEVNDDESRSISIITQ